LRHRLVRVPECGPYGYTNGFDHSDGNLYSGCNHHTHGYVYVSGHANSYVYRYGYAYCYFDRYVHGFGCINCHSHADRESVTASKQQLQ
jgi:hypothetical protein